MIKYCEVVCTVVFCVIGVYRYGSPIVLEFDHFIHVYTLECSCVLECSWKHNFYMLPGMHFTHVLAIPTANDFTIFCTYGPFLLIYSIIFRNVTVKKNAASDLINNIMVWLKTSQ